MEKNKKITNILDIIKDSAIILFAFIIMNILTTSILLLCHISISSMNIIISTVLTVVFVIGFYKNKRKCNVIISSAVSLIILIFTIYLASHTYDLTWDGNTYHKLAVGMLKDGWNPVYESAESYLNADVNEFGLEDDKRNSIWIEHYPKASWFFAANIYSVTQDIESAKIITMLVMYITFAIIVDYLYRKVNIIFALLIAGLIAINPITMVQVFSYYIDGLMGLCIYIILCALIFLSDKSINDEDENKKQNWLILAMAIILCINLKFTGLVYAAIFCFAFFVFWLIRAHKEGKLKEKMIKYITYYVVVVMIAVAIVGFSSYVQNMLNMGHPFHPLMGKNKVDIMTYNQPKSFPERGAIDKFLTSMFSKSENVKSNSTDKDPTLKIPFTINKGELKQFVKPDTRMAGFGVWFSGIFIISMVSMVYLIYRLFKEKKNELLSMIITFLGISFVLVLITDGSWWARYVPYIYLIPILVVFLFATQKGKVNKIFASVLCVLLVVNIGIISLVSLKNSLSEYRRIEKQFKIMKEIAKQDGSVKVALRSNAFPALIYNLKDKRVKITLVDLEEINLKKHVNYFYYDDTRNL